ncbi:HEAT repeat domain-containing protein [Flavobacteriaceae bacterium AU392]|nr:HEAT repeat domain-containing protein [Flavobacteriaceae bacterium]RKM86932.1 HEAT repeat domain-containing protein [Flavobacteriaceae bacterium AU392]
MSLEQFIKNHRNDFNDKQMPKASDQLFESLLKQELHQSKSNSKKLISYLSIAASLVLMFSLGYLYNKSINKKNEIRNQLVLALDGNTASQRIEAVYEIEENYKKEEDQEILNALYKMLFKDANGNVKIAAIDFLLTLPNNQEMRLKLIEALEKEKEPLVQIKLMESLALLREQRAKQPLQNIINDEEILPSVKGSAYASLAMLNQ